MEKKQIFQIHPKLHIIHPCHPSDFSGLLEGWVWKRSRFWKRWRRRWLVLLPEELRSFRSRQAARQRGTQATEVVMKGSVLRVCPGGPWRG